MGIGQLSFECIDFGWILKLIAVLKETLHVGGDTESEKCTALALAAGVEWVSQGPPKRCPSRQRVDVLPSVIRMGEIMEGEQACGKTVDLNV